MGVVPGSGSLHGARAEQAPSAVVAVSDPAQAQQFAAWLAECGVSAFIGRGDAEVRPRLEHASLLVVDRLIADAGCAGSLADLRARLPALRILAVGERLARDAWNLGRMRNSEPGPHRVLGGTPSREAFAQAVHDLV